jgi:TldD protein
VNFDRAVRRDLDLVQRAAELARRRGASFAEVRTSHGASAGLSVQDGRAERMGASEAGGGCVRAIVGGRWGFASTDGCSWRRLLGALEAAVRMARAGRRLGRPAVVYQSPAAAGEPFIAEKSFESTARPDGRVLASWARLLLGIERSARKHARPRAVNTVASFGQNSGWVTVANTQGLAGARAASRSTVALMVVVAERGRGLQRWTERAGRTGSGELLSEFAAGDFARLAAERALAVLRAPPAPGGCFPVILDPATAGVFVHECLGHNAEADLVLSGQSLLDGKLGRRLASARVTVIDDPTVPGAFGSYEFDSEGTPAQRTEIISRGVLKSYLHSLETAARCRAKPTGHGRAEGYGAPPLVRMSNTFFAPGPDRLEDMVRGIRRGLLLEHGSSGQVLSERGHYTVSAGCGRLIENGRLGELVRDASFSGVVLDSLRDIDAVSSDFRLASPGYCGKDGQEVPVDNGGAYVRLRRAVIGGQGKWSGRHQGA